MKNQLLNHMMIRITNSAVADLHDRSMNRLLCSSHQFVESSKNIGHRNSDNFAVCLALKFAETLKGKFRLGARIFQVGGVQKVFKKLFNAGDEEKLMKASQCYLSTTAGPIAGLLFISTERVAFCSERSIKISSPTGKQFRIYYKVFIPLAKIKRARESQNLRKPSQKYIEVVTEDDFDFWFMGFLNHQKTLKCIHQMVMCHSQ